MQVQDLPNPPKGPICCFLLFSRVYPRTATNLGTEISLFYCRVDKWQSRLQERRKRPQATEVVIVLTVGSSPASTTKGSPMARGYD